MRKSSHDKMWAIYYTAKALKKFSYNEVELYTGAGESFRRIFFKRIIVNGEKVTKYFCFKLFSKSGTK